MMVANSFDLWQKDAFFSAAEEVQESADVLESAYRMWIREKREGSQLEDMDELSKELQTALGTAKWQLEEFERAVRLSHGHRCDDITASRHNQFVTAIESQISRIEASLREAFGEEGKQPLRWVNLDKEERDDLAMFLSGVPQIPQVVKDDYSPPRYSIRSSLRDSHHNGKVPDLTVDGTSSRDTSERAVSFEVGTSSKNGEFIIDVEERDVLGVMSDTVCEADKTTGTRRTWTSPNFGALRILVPNEVVQKKELPSFEATPKEKGSKRLFWKQRCAEHLWLKRPTNLFNQFFGQSGGLHRQPIAPRFSCSIQITLALMLSIFLIVPFLVYTA